MSIMRKMFDYVVSIQLIMLILFVLLNIENLDNIEYDYVLDEETSTTSLNFYTLLTALMSIMLLGIVSSFTIFGGGLNEEGSKLLMKYLALVLLIAILFIASYFFLAPLGLLGVIINIIFLLSYALKIIDSLISKTESE